VDGVEGAAIQAAGSDAWIEAACERYIGSMVALATALIGEAAAEDVAHDCFVRVLAREGAIRHDAPLDAYLRRAVVNTCRSRWRRVRIEHRSLASRAPVPTEASPPAEPTHDEPVWRAIRSLPFRQRAAVILRYAEDLSEEQVGDALRVSPGP
jgi:RNA polymerase sigma factor (sigma-70 family)